MAFESRSTPSMCHRERVVTLRSRSAGKMIGTPQLFKPHGYLQRGTPRPTPGRIDLASFSRARIRIGFCIRLDGRGVEVSKSAPSPEVEKPSLQTGFRLSSEVLGNPNRT